MATTRTTAKGLRRALHRIMDRRRKRVVALARDVGEEGVAHARQLARLEGLDDTGAYVRGFEAEPTPDGVRVVNHAPHALTIEYGRRPGQPGPPLQPILEWVQRKLGLQGEEAQRAAFVIRQKIHEEGSPPHFVMLRVTRQVRRVFLRRLRRELGR